MKAKAEQEKGAELPLLFQGMCNSKLVIAHINKKELSESEFQKRVRNYENFLVQQVEKDESVSEILSMTNSNSKIFVLTFMLNEIRRNFASYLRQLPIHLRAQISFDSFIAQIGKHFICFFWLSFGWEIPGPVVKTERSRPKKGLIRRNRDIMRLKKTDPMCFMLALDLKPHFPKTYFTPVHSKLEF